MNLGKRYNSLRNIIQKSKEVDITAITACFTLLSVSNKIDQECAERLSKYQLSESRFIILALLFEYESLMPIEIANLTGVTKPTITSLITSLVKDNLINKIHVPSDHRKFQIALTEKGRNLIQRVFKEHSYWIASITKNLTNSEMEYLTNILNKIFGNNKNNFEDD